MVAAVFEAKMSREQADQLRPADAGAPADAGPAGVLTAALLVDDGDEVQTDRDLAGPRDAPGVPRLGRRPRAERS